MALIEIPLLQMATLQLEEGEALHQVRVHGLDAETVLIEAPEALADREPEAVTLEFAAKDYYWKATLNLLAVYRRWWFLQRPEEETSERIQRRTFVRIAFEGNAVAMPATSRGEPAGAPLILKLLNLSADGCLATSEEVLESGVHLLLFLSLPDVPAISTIARVVRMQRGEGECVYGLRFETLGAAQQEELARFIGAEILRNQANGQAITV